MATKTKKKSAKRVEAKKRPKQTEIPGTERKVDAELGAAAEELADAGETLSEAHEEREKAAETLIALMKKKKVSTYVDERIKVRVDLVEGKEKVKLRRLEEKGSVVE